MNIIGTMSQNTWMSDARLSYQNSFSPPCCLYETFKLILYAVYDLTYEFQYNSCFMFLF